MAIFIKMGIKWDLILLDFLQWSKEKSHLGQKLAICEYKNVFEWFLHLHCAKTKPIRWLENKSKEANMGQQVLTQVCCNAWLLLYNNKVLKTLTVTWFPFTYLVF